jgi:hypothetical protein
MEPITEGESTREIIKDKLCQNFDGKIVCKDLTMKIKEGANVPVYVLEFLLGQYCSSDDDEVIEQVSGRSVHQGRTGRSAAAFGEQPTLREAKIEKNYLDEKELRAMGQLVSGYLDFAERQAEREIPMTMDDWAKHLDEILTSTGGNLLTGNGTISHLQAMDKAQTEYKKYKARMISSVEKDYLDSIKLLEEKGKKKKEIMLASS